MPIFKYSLLTGVQREKTGRIYAELMVFIVAAENLDDYKNFLSEEKKEYNPLGETVEVFDNISYDENNYISFTGTVMETYLSDLGVAKNIDFQIDLHIPQEMFSKTVCFDNVDQYHDFASPKDNKTYHSIGMFSDPDRYFLSVTDEC